MDKRLSRRDQFPVLWSKSFLNREESSNTSSITFLALGLVALIIVISQIHDVSALPPVITFDFPQYTLNDYAVITVDDSTNPVFPGNGITDKIQVTVKSSLETKTITLTEIGDSGIFQNTVLRFTEGPDDILLERTYTISQEETVGVTPGVDTITVDLTSVDELTGTPDSSLLGFVLTETSTNSQVFTGNVIFTAGATTGTALHAIPGDSVAINYNGEFHYGLVAGNPNDSVDILSAANCVNALQLTCDLITVSYTGAADVTADIIPGSGGGGGGGGLIRPGLVLDALAAIGVGSPFIVSPPTFGGNYYHYTDGLTITQGTQKTIFDTSKYNQDIPTQVMISGKKVNMDFKTFEAYNPNGVIHMGLYIIPHGQDMITSNSIGSIVYDKNSPVQVSDPNHILSDATSSISLDGKFQHTAFSFVPTKSYDKMSFLARAWNDHLQTTDIRVHDAIDPPAAPKTLPAGVIQYDTFNNLETALEKDGFYKAPIMAHIHGTTDVFSLDQGGHVYWLYDTINHNVTLVIADKNGDEIYSDKAALDNIVQDKKGDYGFMQFTSTQLNRADKNQEENAMKIEEAKALLLALEQGLIVKSNW